MDLLSVPEYVIKKGRLHGHRYGKKPGDKEYYLANQLKKKCQKREFQGIHDRFLHDQEFRLLLIENHRDEELCRQYKNTSTFRTNGGVIQISKVQIPCFEDIVLVSSKHCLLCNDITTRSRRRTTRAYLLSQTPTMGGTQFIIYMVELARFFVDPFLAVLGKNLRK